MRGARRCSACSKDPGLGAWCQWCFSTSIEAIEDEADGEPARGSSIEVVSADEVGDMQPLIPCKAPIFDCVGGYGKGAVVSVSAPPGGGKTTECLRVAVAQNARVLHLVYGECSREQAKAAAVDAGASPKFFREGKHLIADGAETWQEGSDYLERLLESRKPPEFAIWDSTTNAVAPEEEKAFITEQVRIAADYEIVIFCICQWSTQGRGRGTLTIPHGGAMWISIDKDRMQFKILKARPPWGGKQGVYPRPRLEPGQTWPGMVVPPQKENRS